MQANSLKILFLVWFCCSILSAVVGNFLLWLWLRKPSVKLVFWRSGTPGYLDRVYREYCRSQGRSGKAVLIFRKVLLINAIAAGAAAILLMSGKSGT